MELPPSYNAFLYDANCIIYHCFHAMEIVKRGTRRERVEFKYPYLTDQIHSITNFLRAREIRIETIQSIWEEIENKDLAEIVDEYIKSERCPLPASQIRSHTELHLYRKLKSKLSELKNKSWFSIRVYDAPEEKVDLVRSVYRSLENTAKMKAHLRMKKRSTPEPSRADMTLLIYSREQKLPILSNDTDLTLFKEELEGAGVCYKIISLQEISDVSILASYLIKACTNQ